ncbi:MAG: 2OG-Fe(II) oxygenase [Pseudomonas sp.]|uniref:2OG-Fe(II) oxygenase n=1 Tax=Pseudomonas sp. TaxID=306 RepID=UPI003397C93E
MKGGSEQGSVGAEDRVGWTRRIDQLDWPGIGRALDAGGYAVVPALISAQACASIAAWYPDDSRFRSRIVMQRHGFGQGEYKYFDYPLPDLVDCLRTRLYPHLVPIAQRWCTSMAMPVRFPVEHPAFLARCHEAGQLRQTSLLVRYGPGDYNCLHQDLYGDQVFPLQAVLLLAEPGRDFSGGELVLTEQRPRMQSRVEVVPLNQGDLVIFASQYRPVAGVRGTYRVNLRHGVSRVRSGQRHSLGIIFHDAS